MHIYTKNGDSGKTSLLHEKTVLKSDLRIECIGTIDELNSFIGLIINSCAKELLLNIQNILFFIGSSLACTNQKEDKWKIDLSTVDNLELAIDAMETKLDKLTNFILPSAITDSFMISNLISHIHVCRSVCRRAERLIVKLKQSDYVQDNIIIFINRLSDYFFVYARYNMKEYEISEIKVKL